MKEKAINDSRDAGQTRGKGQAGRRSRVSRRPMTIYGRVLRCQMQRDTRLCVGNPQNALSQV